MDFAAFAIVWDFLEVKVFNPILNVGWASEGDDNGVESAFIANEAWGEGENVTDVWDFTEVSKIFAALAIPIFEAFFWAVCQPRVKRVISRLGLVVRICLKLWIFVCQNEWGYCQKEETDDDKGRRI